MPCWLRAAIVLTAVISSGLSAYAQVDDEMLKMRKLVDSGHAEEALQQIEDVRMHATERSKTLDGLSRMEGLAD